MRISIRQPLADHATDRFGSTLCIRHVKRSALVLAKIELGQVPLQMLWADMVIHAGDPALHDREISLNRIGMGVAANVLANAVVDRLVVRPVVPDASAAVIAHGARTASI
jgi:hypothetical protein